MSLQSRLTIATIVGFFLVILAASGATFWTLADQADNARAALAQLRTGLAPDAAPAVRDALAAATTILGDMPAKTVTTSVLAAGLAAVLLAAAMLCSSAVRCCVP